MKNIILILALALGVKVNAQVVGGYLPVNSTKSATMGGLRVNGNEIVTGTFSVGSTATITGALKASSTMSLGSANLTGGNTGTVAVLSDAVFMLQFQNVAFNPSDGTTFTINNIPIIGGSSSNLKINIPENCELYKWQFNVYTGGTGSAENGTLSLIQNTTVTTLTTGLQYSVVNTTYSNTASVNFASGDQVALYFVGPTWATNPTVVIHSAILWFRRRS